MTTLRPMNEAEYAAWLARAVPAYAADKVASGQWSPDESLELSAREFRELLPQGITTPDNHVYTVLDERGANVGVLWFAVKARLATRIAYVYDVEIDPGRQREGHAYRAFVALEDEVRKLGLAGIALHVFGHNTGARALYAKLGFEPTNLNLYKAVGPSDA